MATLDDFIPIIEEKKSRLSDTDLISVANALTDPSDIRTFFEKYVEAIGVDMSSEITFTPSDEKLKEELRKELRKEAEDFAYAVIYRAIDSIGDQEVHDRWYGIFPALEKYTRSFLGDNVPHGFLGS